MRKRASSIVFIPFSLCALLLLLTPPAPSAQVECEDHVYAWAREDTIEVLHVGAFYNCCALIVSQLETPEPFIVDFLEAETFPDGPCYCMCCIDVEMWAAGFPPGLYTVRVWNEDRSLLYGETEVEVIAPGGAGPALLLTGQSGCYDATSVPLCEPSTWSALKTLFR